MKKAKPESIDFSQLQQSVPRVGSPISPDEGMARMYTKKGRLVLTPALMNHFGIERQHKQPLHYELFFDPKKKRIVIRFVPKETEYSYLASDAKNSRLFELRGPCKRQGLVIKEKAEPVEIKIYRDTSPGVIYFSYEDFAQSLG